MVFLTVEPGFCHPPILTWLLKYMSYTTHTPMGTRDLRWIDIVNQASVDRSV